MFSRGSLYEMLQNPLYLGEVRHKQLTHPGQHEALISKELWESVQQRLKHNRPPGRVHGKAPEVSWLTGLLFDAKGNCFTPSHTTRRGKRYRYYVLQTAGDSRGSANRPRLPAKEIEGTILSELEAVLRAPERLFELVSDQPDDPAEMQAIVRAADVLLGKPGRHAHLIKTVARVTIGNDHVTLAIHRRTLREVLGLEELALSGEQAELVLAADVIRSRGVLRFKVDGREKQSQQGDKALIGAIVKSRGWLELILNGDVTSQRELAAKEGYDERYVSRLLPLAFLAPDLTEAVLAGTQPEHWSLETLLGKVPLDWQEQRKLHLPCSAL